MCGSVKKAHKGSVGRDNAGNDCVSKHPMPFYVVCENHLELQMQKITKIYSKAAQNIAK